MVDSARERTVEILDTVADMTIATLREDGYPQATTVSYVNDGPVIYFGTPRSSRKAVDIERDGRVSLTVNRPYRFWKDIKGLSARGRARRVDEPAEYRKVGKLLFERFPQVPELARPEHEDTALYRVDLESVTLLDYSVGIGYSETHEMRP